MKIKISREITMTNTISIEVFLQSLPEEWQKAYQTGVKSLEDLVAEYNADPTTKDIRATATLIPHDRDQEALPQLIAKPEGMKT